MNWIFPQTSRGSFSAVSKPNFASKYSFCSIFRDLQDWHTFTPLQTQFFGKKSWKLFAKLNIELNQNSIQFFIKTAISQPNFDEILSEFRECGTMCSKLLEVDDMFGNFVKFWEISGKFPRYCAKIQYYSICFNPVPSNRREGSGALVSQARRHRPAVSRRKSRFPATSSARRWLLAFFAIGT